MPVQAVPVPGPSFIHFPAQGRDQTQLRSSVRSISDSSESSVGSPRITRSISSKRKSEKPGRVKPY